MNRQQYDADIVVVGAGPSGLVCAYEAVLAGARVVNLEKRSGPTWSRAGTLYPRVLEIFRSRGVAQRLLDRAFEIQGDPISRFGVWGGMQPLNYTALDTPYPYVVMMPQIETEKVLGECLAEIGGDVRLQHEVTGLTQDADGVTVDFIDGDGVSGSLRARYVVGADGRQSSVRNILGVAFPGHEAQRIAVNVDANIELPFDHPTNSFFNDIGWGMAYPLRKGLTRFVVIDKKTMDDGRPTPPDADAALEMLRRVHGTDYGITSIHQITQFGDATYCAERLRVGWAFLVGESVRVHYPASGIGMQFCIQDAFNLGWKLGKVATGQSPAALLDSFEEERLPEIHRMLDMIRQQTALQFRFDEEANALKTYFRDKLLPLPDVNRMLCEDLSGLSARYASSGVESAVSGLRMPPIPVAGEYETALDLSTQGQFVLLDLTGADVSRMTSPHPQIALAGTIGPADHPALAGLGCVFLRPDGHVAWTSSEGLGSFDVEMLDGWLLPEDASRTAVARRS
ncbi:FAD-dependent monooxygenase [Hoeflea sp. WL0058]|uniref:FAD-dependent monooxygenase n=1 Tax=Flavimaribacter sediminis TaxID=2865987 RepID=A0AAE2ZKG5_9HYPH|nr:FAD-dependent monooxygenase [Flavimaribacter sediminis]MBW8638464.1 FAD-dependent monooxygenase [Flavimaribacter sediminis]